MPQSVRTGRTGRKRADVRLAAFVTAVAMVAVIPPGRAASTGPASPAGPAVPAGLAGASPVGGRVGGPAPAGGLDDRWVTLVTGDRVLVGAGSVTSATAAEGVTVAPAAGREWVAFSRFVDRGHLFVLPSDAAVLVGSGRVDRRLFDVTALLAFGYDDRSRSDLPLIVSYAGDRSAGTARAQVAAAGAGAGRDLSSVDALAVRADKDAAAALWAQVTGVPVAVPRATGSRLAAGISRLWLDGRVRATLDRSVPQIGAPAAWAAGHTGRGVTVAVLDTGIDTSHPDLTDAVVASQDFTGSATGARDVLGHGTHVASIITGSGVAAGGRYAGVAPNARLLVGKVLDDSGGGFDSQIIAGMEWAATVQHAAVVNLSLDGSFPSDGTDLLDQAVDRLTAQTGALFVVAAGNSGPAAQSISSPAAADSALTVGAVDERDVLADFSSRGPRPVNGAIKPDLVAPGVGIVAARASGSTIGDPVGEGYQRLSGTSMAAPHVTGAAAILAGQHPDWHAEQLKTALVGAATPAAGGTVFEQGAGRVDLARATGQQVLAAPASLSEGVTRWPHDDDVPVVRTVAYHNNGADPVTLDVRVDVRGPTGQPAPARMFHIDPARLTVPAGGDATTTLSTDTAVAGPDGNYSGVLAATAGSGAISIRTPVAVTKEAESYDVAFTIRDDAGRPTPNYLVRIASTDTPVEYAPYDASGTVVARVPAGNYLLDADVFTPTGKVSMVAVEPRIAVTRSIAMTIDVRAGKPVGTLLDRPGAGVLQAHRRFLLTTAWGETGTIWIMEHDFLVRPSRTSAPGRFRYTVADRLARPDGAGGFTGSPYYYHVDWSQDGRVPPQPRRIHDRDLAVVPIRVNDASLPAGRSLWFDHERAVRAPAEFTAYYTPNAAMGDWLTQYLNRDEFVADGELSRLRTFGPGRQPAERWNAAVFGPAFPAVDGFGPWAARQQNTLTFDIPAYSDSDPDHFGYSNVDEQTTTLYRDEREVGSISGPGTWPGVGSFPVPAEPSTYRLQMSASRSVSAFSTRVLAVWTFRSGAGPGEQSLPLMAVRFTPKVDGHNRAPAGPFSFPVWVQRQPGTPPAPLTRLEVQVSYDDGRSWQPAPVTGSGDRRTVRLTHPRQARYVSLKAAAADSTGSVVEETEIHAYALVAGQDRRPTDPTPAPRTPQHPR